MIEIKNLSFHYGKEKLFDGLDLSLQRGMIYGLLGENGAGKTTLLKVLSGLLFPKSGDIRVLGYNPVKRTPDMLRELFLLPEEFTLPSCSAAEYEKVYSPFYPRFNHGLFKEYLAGFNIDTGKKINEYSYGQKKKFLIAFGLATECRFLLFDEPTNGLDIPSKSQFRRLVAGAVTEERSFIISTHQVRDMENLIDPLIILNRGRIVFLENLENISANISFRIKNSQDTGDKVLFSERVPGGYMTMSAEPSGDETPVDIEVLFNAVINEPDKIAGVFNRRGSNDK